MHEVKWEREEDDELRDHLDERGRRDHVYVRGELAQLVSDGQVIGADAVLAKTSPDSRSFHAHANWTWRARCCV